MMEVKTNLYLLTIPTTDYLGNGPALYSLYLQADHPPTKEECLLAVQHLHKESNANEHYEQDWQEIEDCMALAPFPNLGNCVSLNTQYEHPKWGKQPLTMEVIFAVKL
jgi:hypothetical protein